MPQFKLDPKQNILICHAQIIGPRMELSLKMAVDTGATYTIIPTETAIAIGVNPLSSHLPPQSPVEGLLGLDFMRKANAIINLSQNIIETS